MMMKIRGDHVGFSYTLGRVVWVGYILLLKLCLERSGMVFDCSIYFCTSSETEVSWT